jgi:hypothetical protein
MAVWVDASANLGAWAAYIGPYIGPWPMAYPMVFDGLVGDWGDEIDFYLGLPNPAGTSPLLFSDGSYPCQVWNTYRWRSTDEDPTAISWSWSATGGAVSPVYGQIPDPGVALYVVCWRYASETSPDLIEPPNPPESYVPHNWVDGATGPVAPWGMTPYTVTGLDVDAIVNPSSGTTWNGPTGFWSTAQQHEETLLPVPADLDYDGVFTQAMENAYVETHSDATAHTGTGGAASGSLFHCDGRRDANPFTFGGSYADANVWLAVWTYNLTPDYSPPIFDPPGVFGVDWFHVPFQSYPANVQYQFPGPQQWHWGPWRFEASGKSSPYPPAPPYNFGSAPSMLETDVWVGWRADALVDTTAPAGAPAGTIWLTPVPVSTDDDADAVPPSGFGLPQERDMYVDNLGQPIDPAVVPPVLTLVATVKAVVKGEWDGRAGHNFPLPPYGAFSWDVGFSYAVGTDPSPGIPLQWQTWPWRWFGKPTAVLKTVGENFLTPGDVVVKSLVPGYGWVPVQRHG